MIIYMHMENQEKHNELTFDKIFSTTFKKIADTVTKGL